MPDLVFNPPLTVQIKRDRFEVLKRGLIKMGFTKPEFRVLRVTADGKVIPDPDSLNPMREVAAAPLNGSLVDFDQQTLNLIHSRNIRLTSI
jgi:hypothetical protein